jgi:hypothetical protein
VFSLASSRRLESLGEPTSIHPHPFPPAFYGMLKQRKCGSGARSFDTASCDTEQRDCFVVFVARRAGEVLESDLALLLDGLVQNERMTTIIEESVDVRAHLAQGGGGISILFFDNGIEAVTCARALRDRFAREQVEVTIGIDRGPVLVFRRGPFCSGGIAGDPINLSSKISEDLGEPGRIRITDRAAKGIEGLAGAESFADVISGVEVKGVIV